MSEAETTQHYTEAGAERRLSFGVSESFARENEEWLRFEAESDAPDAWVYERLVEDLEELDSS